MTESENKMIISDAEWLKPGWIFAALVNGGFQLTQVKVARDKTSVFADAVLDVLDELKQRADTTGIFLAQDDCAVVSEYHPQAFNRTRK
jgi:hypothetical protein